jgi:hypothetical protein
VSLYVTAVPDAPRFPFPRPLETDEDTPLIFQIPVIDPDLDYEGDSVRVYIVYPPPCLGVDSPDCLGFLYQVENDDVTRGAQIVAPAYVTNPRRLLMFIPKHNGNGETTMKLQVEDSHGLRSADTLAYILVWPANYSPTATARTVQVPNNMPYWITTPGVGDVDNTYQELEYRFLSLPSAGQLTLESGAPVNTNDWFPALTGWRYYPPLPDNCADPIPAGANIASHTTTWSGTLRAHRPRPGSKSTFLMSTFLWWQPGRPQ